MATLKQVIATDKDMSADFESSVINLSYLNGIAIQAVFEGTTPTGTFSLLGSCDLVEDPEAVVNFTDLDNDISIDGDGSALWNMNGINYLWLKVVYTRTSGDGECNIVVTG